MTIPNQTSTQLELQFAYEYEYEQLASIKDAARAREDLALFNLAKWGERLVRRLAEADARQAVKEAEEAVRLAGDKIRDEVKKAKTDANYSSQDQSQSDYTLVVTLHITTDKPILNKRQLANIISNRVSTINTVVLVELE